MSTTLGVPARRGKASILWLATAALLAFQGTALAVNPHRPVITNISPNFGPIAGGTTVTFTGTNLRTPITVSFGGNAATGCDFSGITGTAGTFTCNTPASTIFGLVTVIVKNHANGNSGTLVIANAFTYTCDSCTVSPVSALFESTTPAGQTTEPNGIVEPGESNVAFSPTWINASAAGFTGNAFTGALSNPLLTGGTLTTPVASAQYPNLAAGASGQCTTCYTLSASFTGARPSVHVDATVDETPSIVGGPNPDTADKHTWHIHIGNSFTDVPSSNIFYTYVEATVHNNVTFGPGGGIFDNLANSTRDQMAAFISRADAHGDANVPVSGTVSVANNPTVNGAYNCTNGGTSIFADVAPTSLFCKNIHYIANMNVTNGCDPTPNYCTSPIVTRAAMAVFMSRAVTAAQGLANPDDAVNDADTDGGTRSYDCTNGPAPFLDVPLNSPAGTNPSCKNIGQLWVLHIVDGDGAGHFNPTANVTRQEMAKFVSNAEHLSINNP